MEYGKPELLLRDWGIRSTVVVFGSARISDATTAAARLDALEQHPLHRLG